MRRTALVLTLTLLAGLGGTLPTRSAQADATVLTRKQLRIVDREIAATLKRLKSTISREADEIEARFVDVVDRARTGNGGSDLTLDFNGARVDVDRFLAPTDVDLNGFGNRSLVDFDANAAETAAFRLVELFSEELRDLGDAERLCAIQAIQQRVREAVIEKARALRRKRAERFVELRLKFQQLAGRGVISDVSEFVRPLESHEVVDPANGERVIVRRPGLQQFRMDENGVLQISITPPEVDTDGFVGIDIKRPATGEIVARATMLQSESTGDDASTLTYTIEFEETPAPGDLALLTVSTSFDESLLPLVDPFDCLVFVFPGLVPPVTPPSE